MRRWEDVSSAKYVFEPDQILYLLEKGMRQLAPHIPVLGSTSPKCRGEKLARRLAPHSCRLLTAAVALLDPFPDLRYY